MSYILNGSYRALTRFLLLGLLFAVVSGNLACAQQPAAEQKAAPAPLKTDEIATYLRKVFNVPPNVTINVKEEAQSSIPGLRALKVEVTSERGAQTQDAWVTMDGKTLVWGKSYDMSVDPFQENLAKMKLDGAPVAGNKDAKVTIVEYTDFQCPYCSRAHTTVEQLLKEYEGKIKVVYKGLPLAMHNWAEDAAVAGACVAEQNNDAFWTYAHYFFENQKTLTKETLMEKVYELAAQNKLDVERLKTCVTSRATLPRVQGDMKEAQAMGFNSTPSFVVNGRPVIGAVPVEQFRQVIDEALAAAK